MMNNDPYRNQAFNAYQKAHEHGMNNVDIVVALYQGIIRNLEAARLAYQDNDLGKMCQTNQKTFRILAALQCHLDFEKGKDTAPALDNFYTAIFVRLAKVLERPDPAGEFRYLESNVRDVYAQWKKLAQKCQISAPPAP